MTLQHSCDIAIVYNIPMYGYSQRAIYVAINAVHTFITE